MGVNATRDWPAVKLIHDIGLYGLGGYDGCPCTSFEVMGVAVAVSCRKSSGMDSVFKDFFGIGVRVTSRLMDATPDALVKVADEVLRQLADEGYALKVRFCTYEQDSKCQCVYCGKERSNVGDYLCPECAAIPDRLEAYSYPNLDRPEPNEA